MSNRRRLLFGGLKDKNRNNIVAGDILCTQVNGDRIVIDAADYASIPSEWTPIGVVVIPPSHDVYGTGEGAVISIPYMSAYDPDNGTYGEEENSGTMQNAKMRPGCFSYSLMYNVADGSILPYLNPSWLCYYTTNQTQVIETTTYAASSFCVFAQEKPATSTNITTSRYDNNVYYILDGVTKKHGIKHPYLTDGSKNNDYFIQFSGGSASSSLCDFESKEKQQYILNKLDGFLKINDTGYNNFPTYIKWNQINWKTDSKIIDTYNIYSGSFEYTSYGYGNVYRYSWVPVQCCWRYHTIGTNQGDWYVPGGGELGYIYSRRNTIFNSIKHICEITDNYFLDDKTLWTTQIQVNELYYIQNSYVTSQSINLNYNSDGTISTGVPTHYACCKAIMRF